MPLCVRCAEQVEEGVRVWEHTVIISPKRTQQQPPASPDTAQDLTARPAGQRRKRAHCDLSSGRTHGMHASLRRDGACIPRAPGVCPSARGHQGGPSRRLRTQDSEAERPSAVQPRARPLPAAPTPLPTSGAAAASPLGPRACQQGGPGALAEHSRDASLADAAVVAAGPGLPGSACSLLVPPGQERRRGSQASRDSSRRTGTVRRTMLGTVLHRFCELACTMQAACMASALKLKRTKLLQSSVRLAQHTTAVQSDVLARIGPRIQPWAWAGRVKRL